LQIPIIITIVALLAIGGGYVYYRSNNIKITPLAPISTTTSPVVDGDRDAHGCIVPLAILGVLQKINV